MFKINLVNLPSPLKIKMDYKFPEVLPVKLQKKEVQPRTVSQLVYPDSGFNGLSEVSVNAVTNEIDENIKSENIKKDVSILGVQGNIEELKGTKLEITKNGTYIPEEPYNAFTEVDVNMADVSEYFGNTISKGGSDINGLSLIIKKCPPVNISGTNAYRMFAGCQALTEVPKLDTSNITNMEDMFFGCRSLTNITLTSTSNVIKIGRAFNGCTSLTSISQLDTSKVTDMRWLFRLCSSLTNIQLLNASSANYIYMMFTGCNELITFGGLENLGQAYLTTTNANFSNYTLDLSSCTKLTHDSLMNVINNLYDIATKGCNTQQVVIGSTNLAKLTAEEISICTSKGWSVS